MKNLWKWSIIGACVAVCVPVQSWAVTVSSLDFKVEGGASVLEIQADGPIESTQQENPQEKQFVIDIPGAQLAKPASRKLDTSSFDSPVSLVSPYVVDGGARIVVTMRQFSSPTVSAVGNVLRISIPGGASSASASEIPPQDSSVPFQQPQAAAPADAPVDAQMMAPEPAADVAVGDSSSPGASSMNAAPESASVSMGYPSGANAQATEAPAPAARMGGNQRLSQFMETRATGRFSGSPVTIQVRDADLIDVFRLIGEASGFNIVMGDDVKGKLTLSLDKVPWDQALDLILRTQQLGAERTNNVLRIVSLTNLAREKRLELEAQAAAQASTPRITRIFPISYASLSDLQATLTRFAASPPGAGTVSGASLNEPVLIQSDDRTNSILVRDTPDNVEKMRKLIEILDTQTPQVMIEAKVVEASENFNKALGGAFSFQVQDGAPSNSILAGLSFGSLSSGGPDESTISAGANGAAAQFTPTVNFIPGVQRLNALLNYSEGESKAKVIGSPKVVVLNKESANIVSGQPVLIPSATIQNGIPISTASVQQANMSLTVRPTVTNDGSVLLDLNVNRDVPFALQGGDEDQSGIANRTLRTKVLVASGNTLVIGGVYTQSTTHSEGGFPFLRKLPVLGALFGSSSDQTERAELFIFVTPRVLNEKEAGLSG